MAVPREHLKILRQCSPASAALNAIANFLPTLKAENEELKRKAE